MKINKANLFAALNRVAFVSMYFVLLVGAFFLSAGSLAEVFAWIYAGLGVLNILLLSILLWTSNDLLSERAKPGPNAKKWDQFLVRLQGILSLTALVVAGLDHRFNWLRKIPDALQWLGTILLILGDILIGWAMKTNTFFSTHVRIQTDRGHKVINQGPYALMRHPGYTGMILTQIATGLMFGSWLGVCCALLISGLIIYRTLREDQTLQTELEGYQTYTKQTPYRLIPGVW